MNRPALHSVPSPSADEPPRPVGESYADALVRTAAFVRRCGASRLVPRIVDMADREVTERDLDLGRADHVRVCAVAEFPDGHEVIGRSEPISRDFYVLYLTTSQWLDAFADLRNQFGPTVAAVHPPTTGRPS